MELAGRIFFAFAMLAFCLAIGFTCRH